MKTREKINLELTAMNRFGNSEHYNFAYMQSEGLHNLIIDWNNSKIISKLVNIFKEWRGKHEHATYIQVCE